MGATIEDWQKNLKNVKVEAKKSLKAFSTFQIGGPAEWFVAPHNSSELLAVLDFCKAYALKTFVIGAGSNLLIGDNGFSGIVISLENFNKIEVCGKQIVCGAGVRLSKLISVAQAKSLSGLEFLVGIPACVGGAVHNNAGAFGFDMASVVKSVKVFDGKNIKTLELAQLGFDYRKSRFQNSGEIILEAVFELNPGEKSEILRLSKNYFERRKSTQPTEPSAGCVFKRTENFPAGLLIDCCGLKGKTVGGASVSTKHANFIINNGNATANDVKALIKIIKDEVFSKFEIKLFEELEYIGD